MCGAPASSEATACEHCGARLATVACPACFGMMFIGAKFCSHCGAQAARTEVAETKRELCPRCKVDMDAVVVGKTNLRECARCEGIWMDKAAFDQICTDTENQSAVLGMATHLPPDPAGQIEQVRYLPCPVCADLMNRLNFANCSHVIVDVCREHGTWFDRDELRRIVEFIRAGGLNKARANEIDELKRQRQQLQSAQTTSAMSTPAGWDNTPDWPMGRNDLVDIGVTAAAVALRLLFK